MISSVAFSGAGASADITGRRLRVRSRAKRETARPAVVVDAALRCSSLKCRKCAHDNMRRLVYLPFQPSPAGLLCDRVSVHTIVEAVGTPAYVYSARAIRSAFTDIDTAFAEYPHAIHYALKANSTLALLRLLRSLGSRVDANSWGEIQVAQRAGFEAKDIVFTGVGKTRDELEAAIAAGRRHDQRRVGRRTGPHRRSGGAARARCPRRAARQSRHRCAQSSQHLHWTEEQQVRRAHPGGARDLRRAPGALQPEVRRGARAHWIADHDAPSRSPAPHASWCRWRGNCVRTDSRSNTSISAAASGIGYEGRALLTPQRVRGGRAAGTPPDWHAGRARARARDRRPCRRARSRGWWTSSGFPTAGSSRSSTRA